MCLLRSLFFHSALACTRYVKGCPAAYRFACPLTSLSIAESCLLFGVETGINKKGHIDSVALLMLRYFDVERIVRYDFGTVRG